MKRLLSMVCLLVSLLMIYPAQAAAATHQVEADQLASIGLLQGSSDGFDLDAVPTRVQGAAMMVRLLGKEKEAKLSGFQHPFKDVPYWADAYIGYLYAHELTNGTDADSFSPDLPLSAEQYMTFVLRSLGYDDQAGDFTWQTSINQAVGIGLFPSGSTDANLYREDFRRDQMVWVSWLALQTKLKGQNYDLVQKLVEKDHAIAAEAAAQAGIYNKDYSTYEQMVDAEVEPAVIPDYYIVENRDDYTEVLALAMKNLVQDFTIMFRGYSGDAAEDFPTVYEQAKLQAAEDTGLSQTVTAWSCRGNRLNVQVHFEYLLTAEEINTLNTCVAKIMGAAISPGMTEYEKEKALHDYIVNHCQYDNENLKKGTVPLASYSQYGVLVLNKGVCQGYADAMFRLCHEAGLECRVVTGQANDDGKVSDHAWNIVTIDGQCYQLDVTWDDPVSADGDHNLSYNYFNLTDADMALDHTWETSSWPVCSSLDYNYYVYNDLWLDGIDEFKQRLQAEIEQGSDSFTFKLNDLSGINQTTLQGMMRATRDVRSYAFILDKERKIITISSIKYR